MTLNPATLHNSPSRPAENLLLILFGPAQGQRAAVNLASPSRYQQHVLRKSIYDSLRGFFKIRAERWIAETQWHSSIGAKTRHSDYQAIVDMGPPVLGLILTRMSSNPLEAQWFPALKVISGEDPVPVDERGQVQQMTQRWLDWGVKKGLLNTDGG